MGAELIGIVNTNTKGLRKETIVKLTKDWPGGSYLVLRSKPMVPGDRPLIAIGYKYNARKVLYFIVTDNTGSTNTGIPYLSKYPYQFMNVAIRPVARPLVMSKHISAVNEVDAHNKSRFYILLLQTTQVAYRQVFPIYLSILTNLVMLPFALLLVPLY